MEWDLYDKNFNLTGKTIHENDVEKIPDGLYHMNVNVWVINSKHQVLLLKKALNFNLRYPGLWTSVNGNVEHGKTSVATVISVLEEKLGVKINEKDIIELGTDIRDPHHYIYNTFIVYKDLDLKQLRIDDNYFSKVKWADIIEIDNMINNGEIATVLTPRIQLYIKPLLDKGVSKN